MHSAPPRIASLCGGGGSIGSSPLDSSGSSCELELDELPSSKSLSSAWQSASGVAIINPQHNDADKKIESFFIGNTYPLFV